MTDGIVLWAGRLFALSYGQGTFVALVLAIGWLWAAGKRRQERLLRCTLMAAHSGASLPQDQELQRSSLSQEAHGQLPAVSVIMPVKGCRTHSASNWSTQVSMSYDGNVEFIFVVEAQGDPALPVLTRLAARHADRRIRIHVAGRAATCSQKIHNLISGAGVCAPDTRYILFLDDDAEMHSGCLTDLVALMEGDPTLFMATGYPFDIPLPGSSLTAYCVLVYHLPLLIAFSVKQRTQFVWGGCMLLHKEALSPHHPSGLHQAWAQGGYSDDLILAALCTQRGYSIAVPSFAIFPQWLEASYSWRQYINYLHRQLYVLDTYCNIHNRALNHTMMWIHAWASLSFATASLLAVVHCACVATWSSAPKSTGSHMDSHSQAVMLAPCQTWLDVCRHADGMLAVFLLSCVAAHISLHYMTAEVLALLKVLAPDRASADAEKQVQQAAGVKHQPASGHDSATVPRTIWSPSIHFNWVKLWLAFLVESMILPPLMLYTALSPTVEWAGVVYHKSRGRVVPMHSMSTASQQQKKEK